MRKLKIEKGECFGKLIVFEELPSIRQPGGQLKRIMHCRCECGMKVKVRLSKLTSSYTKSCGCLKKESSNNSNWYDFVQPDESWQKPPKESLRSKDKVYVKCTKCRKRTQIFVSGLKTAGSYKICRSCSRTEVHKKKRKVKEFSGFEYLTSESKLKCRDFLTQDKILVKCPKCNNTSTIKLCNFQQKLKKDGIYNCGSCTQSRVTTQATPKRRVSIQEKYGVDHPSQRHIPTQSLLILTSYVNMYKLHIDQHNNLQDISKKLGVSPETVSNYLVKLKIPVSQTIHTSRPERELAEWIKSIEDSEVLLNTTSILYPKELDIYIPEKNFAIEFNGLRWHSEKFTHSKYHLEKTLGCLRQGIFLMHVFEDDWLSHPEIIKGKIKSLLKKDTLSIFARKTKLTPISLSEEQSFLEAHHIQGTCSSSVKLGLELQGQLVSVMTFKRRKQTDVWELVRFASAQRIVGGFSKLLSYFQKHYEWAKIISFADRTWSKGDVYEKTGWTLKKVLAPDYKYIINKERKHKFGFRHKNLKNKLKNYDPTKSEHENMFRHGLYRIYDCGLLRYEIENPSILMA